MGRWNKTVYDWEDDENNDKHEEIREELEKRKISENFDWQLWNDIIVSNWTSEEEAALIEEAERMDQ